MPLAVKHGPATPPSTAQRLRVDRGAQESQVPLAVKHGPATPPSTAQLLRGRPRGAGVGRVVGPVGRKAWARRRRHTVADLCRRCVSVPRRFDHCPFNTARPRQPQLRPRVTKRWGG